MDIRAITDTMGPNELIPLVPLYGVLQSFPGISRTTGRGKERFQVLKTTRDEMNTIVAESRLNRALQSKLSLATKYLIIPSALIRVYREKYKRWEGLFTIIRPSKKILSVTDCINVNQFDISAILTLVPRYNECDLKHDMKNLQAFVIQEENT